MKMSSSLKMAVTHLNVPYGEILSEEALKMALYTGSLKNIQPESSKALISSLFNECTPELIFKCAQEAGSTPEKANWLYLETLENHEFPSLNWKNYIQKIAS